jgi:hypothetical protein
LKYPVANARVLLIDSSGKEMASTVSDADGYFGLGDIPEDSYMLKCKIFGKDHAAVTVKVVEGLDCNVSIDFDLGLQLTFGVDSEGTFEKVATATATRKLGVRLESKVDKYIAAYRWNATPKVTTARTEKNELQLVVPQGVGGLQVEVTAIDEAGASAGVIQEIPVWPSDIQMVGGDVAVSGRVAIQEPVNVRLQRTLSDPTLDQALWVAIRNRTRAMSFGRYQEFMNRALRWEERGFEVPASLQGPAADRIQRDFNDLGADMHGVRAYQTLKLLTETFLLLECGVRIEPDSDRPRDPFDFGEETYRLGAPFTPEVMQDRLKGYLGERAQLPYITRVVKAAFPEVERDGARCRMIGAQINEPCLIELIWSYWMEEGMLVQTMNAVSQRFQNMRGASERDALQNLEIDPLRPLNNLLWGWVQDELNRLTVRRRAYEYTHHYGLTLYGKATSGMRAAESRSKFLEAFHNLLYQSSVFFKEDFQTTVIADGFPLLNSLKEVHLILAQGAQNQFGDLPWTARAEMLLMQYMLGRREIRDFLQSRAMVPYKESWEAQVDTMKSMQGWTDVTVSHFRDLAVYGEQLLLSIRYGDWINVNDEDSAKNWARYFRAEIQGYLHSYRAVTGIDLTNPETVDATIPGILLQKRGGSQQQRAR